VKYLGQTWKINKRQVQDIRRVDLEVDGLPVDALVASCYSGCFILDLALDVAEIGEAAVRDVVELGPFRSTSLGRRSVWVSRLGSALIFIRDVDKLEDKRSPCDDAAASRKEVASDDILENRRLAGRLRAYHNLSNQVLECARKRHV
jgi:hypothetical protein